ncbi:MAG TPA: hypothetical protein VF452_23465 [Candidatus Binatia bacterium]
MSKPATAVMCMVVAPACLVANARTAPALDSSRRSAIAITFPQYEQMQGYKSQREVAVRRTYREIMGTLK